VHAGSPQTGAAREIPAALSLASTRRRSRLMHHSQIHHRDVLLPARRLPALLYLAAAAATAFIAQAAAPLLFLLDASAAGPDEPTDSTVALTVLLALHAGLAAAGGLLVCVFAWGRGGAGRFLADIAGAGAPSLRAVEAGALSKVFVGAARDAWDADAAPAPVFAPGARQPRRASFLLPPGQTLVPARPR
jgi:hypothetical protein